MLEDINNDRRCNEHHLQPGSMRRSQPLAASTRTPVNAANHNADQDKCDRSALNNWAIDFVSLDGGAIRSHEWRMMSMNAPRTKLAT